jgi:uncharacterized membrane protein YgdD (TMEM256/DUF423 family)
MAGNKRGTAVWFFILGSGNMVLAVALGAFGAHGLRSILPPDLMAVYHTANQYHMIHALGLFGVAGAAYACHAPRLIQASGLFMCLGIGLFCGSLYLLSITGLRWIGMITPFGGTTLLIAWLLLAIGALKGRHSAMSG